MDIETDEELETGQDLTEDDSKPATSDPLFEKTQFEMNFSIYMVKDGKKTLFVETSIKDSNFAVERCYFLPKGISMSEHQTLYKQDRLASLHNPLLFESLEEEIRIGMIELLIVFGIEEEFVHHIQKLSVNRENQLYCVWLSDFEKFLTPV